MRACHLYLFFHQARHSEGRCQNVYDFKKIKERKAKAKLRPRAGDTPRRKKTHKPRSPNRIENVSACCIFAITAHASHHNPLHFVAALPRREKTQICCNSGQANHHQKNSRKAPLTSDGCTARPTKRHKSSLHPILSPRSSPKLSPPFQGDRIFQTL